LLIKCHRCGIEFRCIKNEGYLICPNERFSTPNSFCICYKCRSKGILEICDKDLNLRNYEYKRGLIDYIISAVFRCQPDKNEEVKKYLAMALLL